MGYIRLTFYSETLHTTTDVSVIYPRRLQNQKKRNRVMGDPGNPDFSNTELTNAATAAAALVTDDAIAVDMPPYDKRLKYQVLYLISGGGGDYTDWPMDTNLRKICDKSKLIMVMPSIRDFTGMQKGMDFLSFMGEELPQYMRKLFPISPMREDTFIAGFSYGGYFAYRTALNYPHVFGCVGSFCSPLDVKMDVEQLHSGHDSSVKADMITGTDRDVIGMAASLKEKGADIPQMFQTVGTEDFTWDFNISAKKHFEALGLDHTWTQGPGVHGYDYCNAHFNELIDWLPLKKMAFLVKDGDD